MVCSITRGPANPMSAPGSAMLRSPSMAKLAVTPPVVGSVKTEMYGSFASSSRARAAETFASCIRLIVPSIMRAPPEQETTISGWRVSIANSTPRVTFSPTTAPIDPPMNANSIAQTTTGRPFSWPSAVITASFTPSFLRASLIRDEYDLVSTNLSGSIEVIPASCSVQRLSISISKRCFALILKWNWHLGQTNRFSSRSLRKVIVRQFSHLVHRPSVRTRRSSGGVASAIAFFSRLNQAISRCFLSAAIARTQATDKFRDAESSIVYTTLGENALGIRMLHFFHFRDQVGEFHQLGMCVAPGADDMNAFRFSAKRGNNLLRVKHFVADDVVNLVENDQIVAAGVDCIESCLPALFGKFDVFRIGFCSADFYKAPTHGANLKFAVAQHLGRVEFAVVPRAFDKLHHQNAQALANGP